MIYYKASALMWCSLWWYKVYRCYDHTMTSVLRASVIIHPQFLKKHAAGAGVYLLRLDDIHLTSKLRNRIEILFMVVMTVINR